MANPSSTNENQNEKLIRMLEEQLAHSKQQNKNLSKQIEVLTDQVRHLTKLLYGSKTEKSKYNTPDGQASLFEDDPSFNEPKISEFTAICAAYQKVRLFFIFRAYP
ncbi:hypothetical protein [uncultured Metabacillus sp.]|uniref:hypothetical protein n=1 Tax=uncultured Metabacillus sp. TaxID=2860135 RepID=UPI00262CB91F|nr:hypothetical protein [uncultured Metabacillus sp.]